MHTIFPTGPLFSATYHVTGVFTHRGKNSVSRLGVSTQGDKQLILISTIYSVHPCGILICSASDLFQFTSKNTRAAHKTEACCGSVNCLYLDFFSWENKRNSNYSLFIDFLFSAPNHYFSTHRDFSGQRADFKFEFYTENKHFVRQSVFSLIFDITQ